MTTNTPTSLLPVLSTPPHVDGHARGQARSTIIQAARVLNDAEWGAGSRNITGMRVRIPRDDLWANPVSVEYSDTAIREMAATLASEGQLEPLIVTPAEDHRSPAEGGNGGKYLILNGRLRYEAAPLTGIPSLQELDCIVRVYANAYDAVLAGVIMKTSQQPLTDEQSGRLLRRLYALWEDATRRGLPVGEWPTQSEWAMRFGRSQPTIARWMGIARLSDAIREAVDDGRIAEAQAAPLISAPAHVQEVVGAHIIKSNAAGAPMSRAAVREDVEDVRRGETQTPGHMPVRPPKHLLLPALAEMPAVEALRVTLHDATAWLRNTLDKMDNPDPQWMTLYKAMNQPKILDFINDRQE